MYRNATAPPADKYRNPRPQRYRESPPPKTRGSRKKGTLRRTASCNSGEFASQSNGDPVGIRTLDLLIRSQSLYPAELPSHVRDIRHLISLHMAGAEGIEPSTNGFGDRYSTS